MYRAILGLFIFSIFSLNSINADSKLLDENLIAKNSCTKPCQESEPKPCCAIPKVPEMSAYNAPSRINVCGSHDVYVKASFLYWRLAETIYVARFKASGTPAQNDRTKLSTMDYDFKPGFKVGLGYNFGYDDWNAYLEYTWYHVTNSVSRTRPSWSQFMEPIYNRLTSTSGDEIDFKLKFKYDFIDLDLSRWQFEGQKLLLKFFLGMHFANLDQDITSDFKINSLNITNNTIYNLKQWMIGPRIGFNSKWELTDYLSIVGKGSTGLLYQRHKKIYLRQHDQDLQTVSLGAETLISTERKRNAVNGLFELMIGLEFDRYFNRNNYHFNLLLGYDLHGLASQILPPGWFALHGFTLSARLDF